MFRQLQTLILALLTALLIILGGFGIFIAEASSFHGIVLEAQSYDPSSPIDAYRLDGSSVDASETYTPGLPY